MTTGPTQDFVTIKNVSKRFGAVTAVSDVNLSIARGEFFSLLGPSGCGKTTLLRMLAGFETPSQGDIVLDGRSLLAVPPNDRPTNMVFQSYAIFPHLDVAQNIAYGLRRLRLSKAEVARRVENALEMIKLPGYGARRSQQLSGGQRQRVALARALVCQPKLLLLDEPLGALDKRLREEMQYELRQLQRAVGITFVMVTHDQEEALNLSDRIAVIATGRVMQIDSGAELYERPKNMSVAGFIGVMNFLEGQVTETNGKRLTVVADRVGYIRSMVAVPIGAGRRVTVALRPEKLTLSRTAPQGAANVLRGTVTAGAYLGDRRHIYVSVAGAEKPIIISHVAGVEEVERWEAGNEAWVSWPEEVGIVLTG